MHIVFYSFAFCIYSHYIGRGYALVFLLLFCCFIDIIIARSSAGRVLIIIIINLYSAVASEVYAGLYFVASIVCCYILLMLAECFVCW